MCHMSGVTCQVSGVNCQVSSVTCQVSGVTIYVWRWKVCYQRGLPRLVSSDIWLLRGVLVMRTCQGSGPVGCFYRQFVAFPQLGCQTWLLMMGNYWFRQDVLSHDSMLLGERTLGLDWSSSKMSYLVKIVSVSASNRIMFTPVRYLDIFLLLSWHTFKGKNLHKEVDC